MRKIKKKGSWKRLLALLLAGVMVLPSVNVHASVTEGQETAAQEVVAGQNENAEQETDAKQENDAEWDEGAEQKNGAVAEETKPETDEEQDESTGKEVTAEQNELNQELAADQESGTVAEEAEPETAVGQEEDDGQILYAGEVVETITFAEDEYPDNEELFAGYVDRTFYGDCGVSAFSIGTTGLEGTNLALYNALKVKIEKVAAGELASTRFEFTPGELGLKETLSPSDCKVAGFTYENVMECYEAYVNIDVRTILNYLLVNIPYELYWFDKVSGVYYSSGSLSYDYNSMKMPNYYVSMAVDSGYAAVKGIDGDGNELLDTLNADVSKTGAAITAANHAKDIVNNVKLVNGSDFDRLTAYKDKICELTDYNNAAISSGYSGDMNPWQLIYVFDNDPSTKVVCEGYSKAFQYLCDLDGDLECYIVTGYMGGGTGAGPHMWNIVRLGGKSYLADITNSDAGTVGKNGELFIAKRGTPNLTSTYFETYTTLEDIAYLYTINEYNKVWYVNDAYYRDMYGDILDLTEEDYDPSDPGVDPAVVARVRLNKSSLSLVIGESETLTATVLPESAADKTVTWSSSNSAVAAVDSTGKVTAAAKGIAMITVTTQDGGKTAVCVVTVTEKTKPGDDKDDGNKDDDKPENDQKDDQNTDDKKDDVSTEEDEDSYYTVYGTQQQEKDVRIDISSCTVSDVGTKMVYNGKPYTPAPVVMLNGKKLTKDADYRLVYSENVRAGTHTITVRGIGMYKGVGSTPGKFTITAKSVSKLTVIKKTIVAGTADPEPVLVYDGTRLLARDKGDGRGDYKVSINGSLASKGTVLVSVSALNQNYSGEKSIAVSVIDAGGKKSLDADDISLRFTDIPSGGYEYAAGRARKPAVELRDGSNVIPASEYQVSYKNNVNAGTACAVVTAKKKSNYVGTITGVFEIKPSLAVFDVTVKKVTYNGKLQKPAVTVKANGKKLKKNKDYVLEYRRNINAGENTGRVIVTGIGNYEGIEKTAPFTIAPRKLAASMIKSGVSKGIWIVWGRQNLVRGVDYDLTYDLSSVSKGSVAVTFTGKGNFYTASGGTVKKIKKEAIEYYEKN